MNWRINEKIVEKCIKDDKNILKNYKIFNKFDKKLRVN